MMNRRSPALSMNAIFAPSRLPAWWVALSALLLVGSAALTRVSHRFGYDAEIIDMPVVEVTAALALAGAVYCFVLPVLVARTLRATPAVAHRALWIMVAAGLLARLMLMTSEPILEDDYQRYLWDGAVSANGLNPYRNSPADAIKATPDTLLGRLAQASGVVVGRINYDSMTTIYPPVAQAAFALAHAIGPFSLTAWRWVILGCDLTTLALLFVLLSDLGRSRLWAALYWWSPVACKELFNSVHMEAIVLPLVLHALVLAGRHRHVTATAALALATGTKVWPALLLPIVLRPVLSDRRRLTLALAVFAGIVGACAVPMLIAGMGEHSGFLAYANSWKTASALFPSLEYGVAGVLGAFGLPHVPAGTIVRIGIAAILGGLAIGFALRPIASLEDRVVRVILLLATLVLLSPAQYPWYGLWIVPLLAVRPSLGFRLLAITGPLYYLSFHFDARDQIAVFNRFVVFAIWLPVWLALAWDAWPRSPRGGNAICPGG